MHFLPFKIRVVPRTLKFKQPAGTSRGVYYDRKVWYIVITSTDPQIRFTGLGECAPLYDLSCDYDSNYEERMSIFPQRSPPAKSPEELPEEFVFPASKPDS